MNDAELIDRFERQAIPRSEWTHRAHVRTAWLVLGRDGMPLALDRLRDGIKRLNRANGVVDTPENGYHETVTVAFARLIDHARRAAPGCATSDAFCNAHPEFFSRDTILRHYSRERINSAEARARFVEPDLEPLPG